MIISLCQSKPHRKLFSASRKTLFLVDLAAPIVAFLDILLDYNFLEAVAVRLLLDRRRVSVDPSWWFSGCSFEAQLGSNHTHIPSSRYNDDSY